MFYSQDYLLSKQVGLRVVWLASTLGSANASAFRKITKREIANVDVRKTCEAVVNPARPLALRTSSHLMYGVVRVYTKQAEYWMSDVQTSYASIRKLILQAPHGTVTTLGGIVVVGQDTSAIDMPGRSRRATEAVTLPVHLDLHQNGLFLNADWLENGDEEDGEASKAAEWQTTGNSLSLFGDSIYGYSSERARDGSVDLGQGLATPPHQPYTADPSSIMRRDTSMMSRNAGIDTAMFDMDLNDLPELAGAERDVQLDLGLDTGVMGLKHAQGLDFDEYMDDQNGFDVTAVEGQEGVPAEDQLGPPRSSPHDTADERPSKRARIVQQDRMMELRDNQIREQREQYAKRMHEQRAEETLRRLKKEAEREATSIIFGPTSTFAGASMLKNIWTVGMDAKLASMQRLDASRVKRATGGAEHGSRLADDGTNVMGDANEQGNLPPLDDYNPFLAEDQNNFTQGGAEPPRASTPAWEAEIGRAGLSSETIEMPWNRTIDQQPGGTTLGGETTVGFSTHSFSLETPTGPRRHGHASLLNRTSVGGRATIGGTGIGDGAGDDGEGTGAEAAIPESQAFAEQDMLAFLQYTVQIDEGLAGDQPLFFSDLAPVADASPAVAARAFHHILSLTTAHRMSAKQAEPYGEIEIRLL